MASGFFLNGAEVYGRDLVSQGIRSISGRVFIMLLEILKLNSKYIFRSVASICDCNSLRL